MSFERALPTILAVEGGFVDDPDDPGGATNQGITQKTYDDWRQRQRQPSQPVRNISAEEVQHIYRHRYWVDGRCDRLPWPLSLLHFDACVNIGLTMAAKLLQRAVRVPDDGVIGPQTISAATAQAKTLLDELLWLRVIYYRDIVRRREASGKFLVGWITRLDHVRDACRATP